MAKLVWDAQGAKLMETGTSNGVLYPVDSNGAYSTGVAFNGMIGVDESPSGAEPSDLYADDILYGTLYSAEKFGMTLKAYTYPDEFAACDGSAEIASGVSIGQQERKVFGFCYKTVIANDTDGNNHGYKLHLVYGCKASPSAKSFATINDSPSAIEFSWTINATPVNTGVANTKATATLVIDSTKFTDTRAPKLKALEDILYGVDAPEFDQTKTYAVGDYVTHTNKLYRCTTAVTTAGVWDDNDWTEVTNPGPRLPLPSEVLTIIA